VNRLGALGFGIRISLWDLVLFNSAIASPVSAAVAVPRARSPSVFLILLAGAVPSERFSGYSHVSDVN
jgi:hypothetical protein